MTLCQILSHYPCLIKCSKNAEYITFLDALCYELLTGSQKKAKFPSLTLEILLNKLYMGILRYATAFRFWVLKRPIYYGGKHEGKTPLKI